LVYKIDVCCKKRSDAFGKVVKMKRTWSILGSLSILALLSSCGGDTPGGPTGGTPTPTPVGAATATPTPGGTATPVPTAAPPDEDANPGPVTLVFTRVYVAKPSPSSLDTREGNGTASPYYDEKSNNEVVFLNEFIILDTTPKNAAGQKCQAQNVPQWEVPAGSKLQLLGVNGIGSNPFQFRAIATGRGLIAAYTVIDGVRSNVINIEIR
jgi:hypothetical protein